MTPKTTAVRIAYFDCFSGASGDMLLGALLDAGLELEDLQADLSRLALDDYELTLTRQVRVGITGSKFEVLDRGHHRPAHNLEAVRHIIEAGSLEPEVAERSLRVFQRLAEAEASVHGTTVDEVHFHEVGAVDALVDIVGFCCAVHRLEIEALYASPLPLGSGKIVTEHGVLPVPAPATLALLVAAGAPTIPCAAVGELVTPTGAALLSTLARFECPPMTLQKVGYGFGTREYPWPNAVRVWLGEAYEPRFAGPSPFRALHEHPHEHKHAH